MRTYSLNKGTVRLLVMKPHRNHRSLFKGYQVGHVSRKPEWLLKLIGIIWTYFGVQI